MTITDDRIFHPLILAAGSHKAGSGKGCAMNIISWQNGDVKITDYPSCSDPMLSRIVQGVNDSLAGPDGLLSPENSVIALDLGHATVGTAYHSLSDLDLKKTYVTCAVFAARKVLHLTTSDKALSAILAAEAWIANPSAYAAAAAAASAAAAADSASAAYAAAAAASAAAADSASAAYAAAAASAAAADSASAYASGFKVTLAWEIINLFKELTGTTSVPLSTSAEIAYEKMLEVTNV